MALMCEHLSRMGVALHNDDYASMILMSFPESYTLHLETLTNAMNSSGNPLTAHGFITRQSTYMKSISYMPDATPNLAAKTPHSKQLTQKAKARELKDLRRMLNVLIATKRDISVMTATDQVAPRKGRARAPKRTDRNPERVLPTRPTMYPMAHGPLS